MKRAALIAAACLAAAPAWAAVNYVARAKAYEPELCRAIRVYWPAAPAPDVLAAQAEQESFWNPRATLQTSREYGFGLYQITVTPSFNNFNVVKRQNPLLADWQWAGRWDPYRQMLAGLTLDRAAANVCAGLMAPGAVPACMLSAYNGGAGGLRADRRLCANTRGCNPRLWFGNVANVSTKSKVAAHGYGKSFYQINREYVINILLVRRSKYAGTITCKE